MQYCYFYKITNKINNHYYYGVHSTNNLDDNYMGSGHRLQIAIRKYGIENFSKEILKFFATIDEAYEYEAEVVNESLITDDNCYNLALGGRLFNGCPKGKITVKSSECPEFHQIDTSVYYANKDQFQTTWYGRHHTEESKRKTREKMTPECSNNPRIWVTNVETGVVKYILKYKLPEFIEKGFILGRQGYKPRKNKQGKKISD